MIYHPPIYHRMMVKQYTQETVLFVLGPGIHAEQPQCGDALQIAPQDNCRTIFADVAFLHKKCFFKGRMGVITVLSLC